MTCASYLMDLLVDGDQEVLLIGTKFPLKHMTTSKEEFLYKFFLNLLSFFIYQNQYYRNLYKDH